MWIWELFQPVRNVTSRVVVAPVDWKALAELPGITGWINPWLSAAYVGLYDAVSPGLSL